MMIDLIMIVVGEDVVLLRPGTRIVEPYATV